MIRSYRELKKEFDYENYFVAMIDKSSSIPETEKAKLKEKYRNDFIKECREFYKYSEKAYQDPYSVPVFNDKGVWRTVSDDDGETGTDFIIIPDNGQTEEEIKEFVYDSVFCGYGDLLIDCTGKKCSRGWYHRRTPCGIVITHDWVFDF